MISHRRHGRRARLRKAIVEVELALLFGPVPTGVLRERISGEKKKIFRAGAYQWPRSTMFPSSDGGPARA